MNATRNTWPWGLVLLGGLLWALPVTAQGSGNRCEASCNTKSSEHMKDCAATCPQPSDSKDMKAMSGHKSCIARCSAHFKQRSKMCKKKCSGGRKFSEP